MLRNTNTQTRPNGKHCFTFYVFLYLFVPFAHLYFVTVDVETVELVGISNELFSTSTHDGARVSYWNSVLQIWCYFKDKRTNFHLFTDSHTVQVGLLGGSLALILSYFIFYLHSWLLCGPPNVLHVWKSTGNALT